MSAERLLERDQPGSQQNLSQLYLSRVPNSRLTKLPLISANLTTRLTTVEDGTDAGTSASVSE